MFVASRASVQKSSPSDIIDNSIPILNIMICRLNDKKVKPGFNKSAILLFQGLD